MPISICINYGDRDRLASALNGKNQDRQYRHNMDKGGSFDWKESGLSVQTQYGQSRLHH